MAVIRSPSHPVNPAVRALGRAAVRRRRARSPAALQQECVMKLSTKRRARRWLVTELMRLEQRGSGPARHHVDGQART